MARDVKSASFKRTSEDDLDALFLDLESDSSRRMLTAAVRSFAARGYHATTTRDISVAAGMSPAALYVHFRSKEDVLFSICRIAHERAFAALVQSVNGAGDPRDRVRSMVRNFTVWHAQHAALARVAQYELDALSPENHAQIATLRRATERLLRHEIAAGIDVGVFHVQDARIATLAVVSMGIDVARWFRAGFDLDPASLGERYADLALAMLENPTSRYSESARRQPRPGSR